MFHRQADGEGKPDQDHKRSEKLFRKLRRSAWMHADPRGFESVRRRMSEGIFGMHPAGFFLSFFRKSGSVFTALICF
jgi:hypothetical protein